MTPVVIPLKPAHCDVCGCDDTLLVGVGHDAGDIRWDVCCNGCRVHYPINVIYLP